MSTKDIKKLFFVCAFVFICTDSPVFFSLTGLNLAPGNYILRVSSKINPVKQEVIIVQ